MGRKCSVDGCLSDSNRPEDMGVTFHKVPMHSDVRPKWLSLCHIPEDKQFVKIIYVCSRHFLRADFCNFKGKKYMLKQGVLPSVFPWDKSKLEAIKAEANVKKDKPSEAPKQGNSAVKDDNSQPLKSGPIGHLEDSEMQNTKEPKEKSNEKSKLDSGNEKPVISFAINSRIEALDFNNEWFPARIVEVDYEENEVLIHFEKFSSKYDEWISMNSSRLRPLQTPVKKMSAEQFAVGDRCQAAWSDCRKFPATITKVMENGTYEVLFDDGFVKILKGHRISKAQGKPVQKSPLFEPITSSKQDRREKKRKLNVAQLFKKRARIDHSDEQSQRLTPPVSNVSNDTQQTETIMDTSVIEMPKQPVAAAPAANTTEKKISNWKPKWKDGTPVGTPSTIETSDGPQASIIIPDPRIPQGWDKHAISKNNGSTPLKWNVIIVGPNKLQFTSRADLKKYLDENPIEALNDSMFDFTLAGRPRAKKVIPKSPKKNEIEEKLPEASLEVGEIKETNVKEEEPTNTLKILFEDDAYKCPIEGCGKIFRKENLAQMHVKHYHPEYTKFLDSTPNVADLAYARTVGENLDKSPGPPPKPPSLKPAIRTSTPKSSKSVQPSTPEMPELKPAIKIASPVSKSRDTEILKLLNSKPFDQKGSTTKQTSSAGPSNIYPDIKLKDLLYKSEGIPKNEDINLKTLSSSRPSTGIKTLLPVVRQSTQTQEETGKSHGAVEDSSKLTGKPKKGALENIEIIRGKESQQQQPPPPQHYQRASSQNPPNSLSSPSIPPTHSDSSQLSLDTPQQHSQNSAPNNIIIEGGEVIKIVRMKQEEIINCTCGFTEEDGLMIQCELCLCWQHAYCNNIEKESQVPDKYICYICQNPLRERASRKYYHDQDWLKQGVLPVGSYHTKDGEALAKRFEKLKKCHDLSGGLVELRDYMHSLEIKLKIAEAKNHPKLYLWSKPWEKLPLPEKRSNEELEVKPKKEIEDPEFEKSEVTNTSESQHDSKLDINSLMENTTDALIIPRPEAAINSADCKLNLLDHIRYQETLVEERLDEFENQIEVLEEVVNMDSDVDDVKLGNTLQMLMRDLETLKEFSHSTTI